MKDFYELPATPAHPLAIQAIKEGVYTWQRCIDEHIGQGRVLINDESHIMLSGYSYLGLIKHPELKETILETVDQLGTGCYGARPMAGTTSLHKALEQELSEVNRTQDTIIFPSGYQANLSTISALTDHHDVIIVDLLAHASIVDGCTLSRARTMVFRHNDINHLRRKLVEAKDYRNRLVVVDAVYSMDGDIAPLAEIAELCREHNALLMVDEAHSFGVLGDYGFGIEEHFGLPAGTIDVKLGVLSKAIPGTGGYVSGSEELVFFLRHTARSYIFSGSTSPLSIAVALATIKMMRNDNSLVKQLWQRSDLFHAIAREKGFNTGRSETPIVPVVIPDINKCMRVAKYCMDNGVYLQAIPYPVVPKKQSRLRITVTAEHTEDDLYQAADVIEAGLNQAA